MTTTTGIYNQSARNSNYKKRILIVDDDKPDIAKSEDRFIM
jgi:PleD family two-component response regulator